METDYMKDTHIDVDHCIQEALQGNIVHLNDNLYFGGVSKSMLKQSRLNFDKIEKCE